MTAVPGQLDANLINQNLNQNNQGKVIPETVWHKKHLLVFKKRKHNAQLNACSILNGIMEQKKDIISGETGEI